MQDTDRVRQLCDHVQEEGGQKPGGLGRADTVSAGKGERNDLLPRDDFMIAALMGGEEDTKVTVGMVDMSICFSNLFV